jgi:hypothetical protein
MHSSSVSASLRHGITTDNSNGPVSGSREGFRFATVGIFSTQSLRGEPAHCCWMSRGFKTSCEDAPTTEALYREFITSGRGFWQRRPRRADRRWENHFLERYRRNPRKIVSVHKFQGRWPYVWRSWYRSWCRFLTQAVDAVRDECSFRC